MSDLEKTRAATLLSAFVLAFALLFAFRPNSPAPSMQALDSVELCAATRGSLCEDVSNPVESAHRLVTVDGQPVTQLGEMTASASRLSSESAYRLRLAAAYGFDPETAIIGSMIVSAVRMSGSAAAADLRLAEGNTRTTDSRHPSIVVQ